MAARPSARTAPNTPFLNRPSDGSVSSRNGQLPTGRCSYTNLGVGGTNPPRCGCQRFWDRTAYTREGLGIGQGVEQNDDFGWCHCSHHACFHESEPARDVSEEQAATSASLRSVSQQSLKLDVSLSSQVKGQSQNHHKSQRLQAPTPEDSAKKGGIGKSQVGYPLPESILPDTSSWDCPAQSESGGQVLPPIPSQCLLPSDISSGNISRNSNSFASLPGQDFHSYFHSSGAQRQGVVSNPTIDLTISTQDVPFDQYITGSCRDESFQSATEVITASPRGSPDLGVKSSFVSHAANSSDRVDDVDNQRDGAIMSLALATTVGIKPTSEPNYSDRPYQILNHLSSNHQVTSDTDSHVNPFLAHRNLKEQVQNHQIRLDNLENVHSYSFVEETHDQILAIQGDIDEIRTSIGHLEAQQAMNDISSVASSRLIDDGNGSMISTTSSAMVASALNRAQVSHRLAALETQITDLRSVTSPSYAHPCIVEVVFLPFGSQLRGIWSTLGMFRSQRSRNNSTAPEDRQTQFSTIPGDQTLLNHAPSQQLWEDVHHPFRDWLVPRACRQGSKVEERLRSRGLVKEIQIKGPEARDVQAAMNSAFGDLLRTLECASDLNTLNSLHSFHALHAPWIPLRKLHRDSRLRLLESSEMITPALWTLMFLSSSVAMRSSGVKRLYVTQRESYIQSGYNTTEWTWQKLRVLPRVFPNLNHSSSEVGEADAKEVCWEYDSRLDPPPSLHSSFESQHSSLSIRPATIKRSRTSQSSDRSFVAASPVLSTTPASVGQGRALSPLMERHVRPLHSRTASMPILVPLKISPSQSKRRITSFDHEFNPNNSTSPQSSPTRQSIAISLKRRRISRSPSRPRDTPRWSVGPPSPYYFDEPVETKRGTTPFAYATPHSNIPYGDFLPHSIAGMTADDDDDLGSTTDDANLDGDLDLKDFDTDVEQDHQPEDDVWEGVEEQTGDEAGEEDSDQEQKALSVDEVDGDASDASSQPSEYPSTQPIALYAGNKGAFHIHVDEDDDESLNTHVRRQQQA